MRDFICLSLCALSLMTAAVRAAITSTISYPLGETGSLGTNYLPLDSGSGARHFTNATGGTNTQVLSDGVWAPGSSAYLSTAATTADGWSAPNLLSGLSSDNFAFGVFVRAPAIESGDSDIMTLGDTNGALKLSLSSSGWSASAHYVTWIGPENGVAGSFSASQWVHLAVVRRGGISTFFINGVAKGTWSGLPVHGTPLLCTSVGKGTYFHGDVDQARIVTFDSGSDDAAVLASLWGAASLPLRPPWVEQTFSTLPNTRYLATFNLSPAAGLSVLPAIALEISGNGALVNQSLPTSLPVGGNSAPFSVAFTADSAQSTVRLIPSSGVPPVVSGLQILQAIEPAASSQPSAAQQAQIDRRYGMFIHFGINTFVNQQWTDGTVPVSSYNPATIDADQWAKTARDAGMRHIILTAKHHDGFCLWDSPWTTYDVASSPVQTDVIAAAAAACAKYGIKLGIYYSLWDRHDLSYNDDAAYNQYMLRQLAELLGNYGPVCELWLDGGGNKQPSTRWANSELYDLVKRLQPDCQVTTNWAIWQSDQFTSFPNDFRTADPMLPSFPDRKLYKRNNIDYYLPFESTVTLSSSDYWFYDTRDTGTKPIATLAGFYYTATAQDNILILNAAPDRSGVIREIDRQGLFQLRDLLGLRPGMPLPKLASAGSTGTPSSTWNNEIANYGPQRALDGDPSTRWASGPDGATTATFEINLGTARSFDRLLIDEFDDAGSGRIRSFQLQAWTGSAWLTFHTGTTCGRFKLVDFPRQSTARLRLQIDAATNAPSLWELQVFDSGHAFAAWRDAHFTGADTLPASEMEADPDGDELPNRLEFTLGSNPNARTSLPVPTPTGAKLELVLPWNSQASTEFGSVSYSLDLVHWFDASSPQHTGVGPMISTNGQRTWQIDPQQQPKWFYQLR